MNNRIVNYHKFVTELELDSGDSPEFSGGDSPRSAASADAKIASTPSSKKRRAIQKRVVSVAMKDVEGFRLKGDQISAPPSDSWAWRKYGQKPIKGSPYPRGYYRCSSSKGCPARKQVERSRLDSQMLVVTYYCEHNHPWPPSRNHHRATKVATPVSEEEEEEEEEEDERQQQDEELDDESKKNTITINPPSHEIMIPDYRFSNLGEGTFIQASEFGWLTEFESSINCSMHESTILTEDIEMATIFQMPEEDERLFADLGELPECSAVFRRGLPEQRPRVTSMATTG